MNMIKFNSLAQPNSFANVLDDIFNKSISDIARSATTMNAPMVNILEADHAFIIELAAPGLTKKDFDINIEKDQLTISTSVENKVDEPENNLNYRKREFNYSAFKKSFHLPESIDAEKITAKYDNGVLKLKLEKKEEAKVKEPRTIAIK